ncbi:hypothetical protein HYV10_01120 [Candidatus Dependentiae bacterium]|nr:hypothetical protein [Candidatus Dependentiae bacterium]
MKIKNFTIIICLFTVFTLSTYSSSDKEKPIKKIQLIDEINRLSSNLGPHTKPDAASLEKKSFPELLTLLQTFRAAHHIAYQDFNAKIS